MRLAEFILANVDPILTEWDAFAHSIWPPEASGTDVDPARLRNDAEEILRATARDMLSEQTGVEQSDKSKGEGGNRSTSHAIDRASLKHGAGRVSEGFALWAVVAEYRALRASVLRLWRESDPTPDRSDIEDVTRFNESIDQSLTEGIRSYTEQVERDRQALLSNEQKARQEAEDANRAKDMFLATLSHEMRTPLNAITGWIHILRVKGGEGVAEGLDVIERNTKAQVRLIEEVLDVSRIVSGKMRLDIADCDLRDSIHAGVEAVRPAARARNISIDLQLEPAGAEASCDTVRMQQVVWNLLSNAIKFTPKGGAIGVRLTREASSHKLTVSDNGQGMSPDLLPYIFDRFWQADSGTRRRVGGLGLGLSIVKHLVEMHGGTVEAASEGEHLGSTFTVRLPIRAVNRAEVAGSATSAEPSNDHARQNSSHPAAVRLDGVRVLVVDDERDARLMLAKVLEGTGAKVTVTSSAEAALDLIANGARSFDVLVSDLGMPDQDGFDLIRELRRLGHDAKTLPAIALTGFVHPDDGRHALAAGFQLHIPKPVDVNDLAVGIASLVGRKPS